MNAAGGEAGQGHPLPASDEARTGELPEHLMREKGTGDDARDAARPDGDAVAPDGQSYEIERDREPHRGRARSDAREPDQG